MLLYVNHLYISVLEILVGFCLYLADFAKDVQVKLGKFHELLLKEGDTISKKNQFDFKMKFFRIIQFHADAKQLSSLPECFEFIKILFFFFLDLLTASHHCTAEL